MALSVSDSNVYSGLQIIVSKVPTAGVRSQLGCLSVPEAVTTLFTGFEISTLETLGWRPDVMYGGFYYNVSGHVYVPPAE